MEEKQQQKKTHTLTLLHIQYIVWLTSEPLVV